MRGTVEDGKTARFARPLPFERSPNPRRNAPREGASTVRNQPTPFMGELVWSEVSFLFTTAMASRGTDGVALFFHEEIRAFTTWNFETLLLVSSSGTPGGPETKKPLRSIAREGFGKPNWKRPQPIPPPRESMRLYRTVMRPRVFSVQS